MRLQLTAVAINATDGGRFAASVLAVEGETVTIHRASASEAECREYTEAWLNKLGYTIKPELAGKYHGEDCGHGLLSFDHTCTSVGAPRAWLRDMADKRMIPYVQIGRRRMFDPRAVRDAIREMAQAPEPDRVPGRNGPEPVGSRPVPTPPPPPANQMASVP